MSNQISSILSNVGLKIKGMGSVIRAKSSLVSKSKVGTILSLNISGRQVGSAFEFYEGSDEMAELSNRAKELIPTLGISDKDIRALGQIDLKTKGRYTPLYQKLQSNLSREEFEEKWYANLGKTDRIIAALSEKKKPIPDDWERKLLDVDWLFYNIIQEAPAAWVEQTYKNTPDRNTLALYLKEWILGSDAVYVFLQEVDTDVLDILIPELNKDGNWGYITADSSAVLLNTRNEYSPVEFGEFVLHDTVAVQHGDNILISAHLSSKPDKYRQEYAEVTKFAETFKDGYNVIIGIDANYDINEHKTEFNVSPDEKSNVYTVDKMRTHLQFQTHKADLADKTLKDFIVSNLPIESTNISQVRGGKLNLIPNANHPFDHYALSATIRFP